MGSPDLDYLRSCVGRREVRHDRSASELLNALAATLDDSRRFSPGMPVPPLWHWIFFRPEAAQSQLREDGHPIGSGLLPPIPLPRRMWAGSRLRSSRPLLTDQVLTRLTTIDKIVEKQGTEGLLVFVTLRHEISDEATGAIVEEQDLVYRPAPSSDPETRSVPDGTVEPADWRDRVDPSTPLLFRYSALTFNAHRIHYDRTYAQTVERYAGLIVHGPLVATLLLQGAERHWPGDSISSINYRALRPIVDTEPLFLAGCRIGPSSAKLWAHDLSGRHCANLLLEFGLPATSNHIADP
jgi:3-methylfumaryl-CoA hydratase